MNAEEFQKRLDDYVDGRLEGRRLEEFERALEADPVLRKEARAHADLVGLMRRLASPKAPEGLRSKIMDQLRADQAAVRSGRATPAASPLGHLFHLLQGRQFQVVTACAVAAVFVAILAVRPLFQSRVVSRAGDRAQIVERYAGNMAVRTSRDVGQAPSEQAGKPMAKAEEARKAIVVAAAPESASARVGAEAQPATAPAARSEQPATAAKQPAKAPMASAKSGSLAKAAPESGEAVKALDTKRIAASAERATPSAPSAGGTWLGLKGEGARGGAASLVARRIPGAPAITIADVAKATRGEPTPKPEYSYTTVRDEIPGRNLADVSKNKREAVAENTFLPRPLSSQEANQRVDRMERSQKLVKYTAAETAGACPAPLVINVLLNCPPRNPAGQSAGRQSTRLDRIMPGAPARQQQGAPSSASLTVDQIQAFLRTRGIESKLVRLRLDDKSGRTIDSLVCSVRGRDLPWVVAQLAEIGVVHAPALDNNSISSPICAANAAQTFRANPWKKGITFFEQRPVAVSPPPPTQETIRPDSAPLLFLLNIDKIESE